MAINLNEDKPQAQATPYPAEHGQQLEAMSQAQTSTDYLGKRCIFRLPIVVEA
ncbi:hypothetical protein GE21DRAFT_1279259 [Neurospora crassa]|nr:hypothetical protein GE21DRAFT_1279259 [Neurospora crassa]